MKKLFLIFFFNCASCIVHCAFSQSGEWTWLHGDSIASQPGSYGTQGIPSSTNNPAGVYEPCEWTDLNGDFWLYGGRTPGGDLDDLWKYNPITNQWTWMRGTHSYFATGNFGTQGVSSPINRPPSKARAAATWIDANGNLWVFGGAGPGFVPQSDLWKYEISTNEWTWMKGPNTGGVAGVYGTMGVSDPANNPGARCESAAAWTDNAGNLWFFGGGDNGIFNDLWRYNIASNEWTWMKGSSLANQPGRYGTLGVEDPLNSPGARMSFCRWKDNMGNFWLFGGGSFSVYHNDLWRFNPLTNNWTWISGDSIANTAGHYGTKCFADPSNMPRSRFENKVAWTDSNSNLWMFGGATQPGLTYQYNDLWMYCISTNIWFWISGESFANPIGNWGTLGVSSPLNNPGGRAGGIGWTDFNGHLYFFGGVDYCNDLWKYTVDTNCISCLLLPNALFTAPNSFCPGTCTYFTNLSYNATTYQWFFPGANPDTSTDVNPANICYTNPGTYDVTLIATGANGIDTLTLQNYITVHPSPSPQSITQSNDTLFAIAGAASYQWYFNTNILNGATDYFYVAQASGDYNVFATDTNGCEVEAVINNVIASLQFPVYSSQLEIFPNPVSDKFTIHDSQFTIGTAKTGISIYNVMGEKVMEVSPLSKGEGLGGAAMWTVDCRSLSSGLYYLELKADEKIFRSKFVKQ